jgi:hypothetical protein
MVKEMEEYNVHFTTLAALFMMLKQYIWKVDKVAPALVNASRKLKPYF